MCVNMYVLLKIMVVLHRIEIQRKTSAIKVEIHTGFPKLFVEKT
jgi:hypothetical protein